MCQSHPDTLYLVWSVIDGRQSVCFALQNNTRLRYLPIETGSRTLKSLVEKWRNSLTTARREGLVDERIAAQTLSRLILHPLEEEKWLADSQIKRICFIADAPLLDIPFAALIDKKGRRLIERFPVAVSSSLNWLIWSAPRHSAIRSLLCAADPEPRADYAPLPNARKEGAAVAGLFPQSLFLKGQSANRQNVLREITQSQILLFGTHAVPNFRNGFLSGLLLASPDAKHPDFLTAQEISSLPLSAELAVLSACQTARGQTSTSEGLVGLEWAFRAAGVPSIVSSLWEVSDESTQILITRFFKSIRNGTAKDEALREAMLTVKSNSQYPAPYYWAAFRFSGEPSPIKIRP